MAEENKGKLEETTTLADLLNKALESTKGTVANLNEALGVKKGTQQGALPNPAEPSPVCPDADKSA